MTTNIILIGLKKRAEYVSALDLATYKSIRRRYVTINKKFRCSSA
jgi:hypothetical protein